MSTTESVRSYKPREWKTYQLPISASADWPHGAPDTELKWCSSNSPMAARYGDDPRRFYVDRELVAAGVGVEDGSGEPERLVFDWPAPDGTVYPAGTLMMQVYPASGMSQHRRTFALEALQAQA